MDLLDIAWRARRNVLLEGPTGIGKSAVVQQFAARAGIGFVVLDLSLLEPPDLVGLPVIREGRTHDAVPSELPTSVHGVLMLEELDRAEIPVMQPALQLLSARRLHDYELPPGTPRVVIEGLRCATSTRPCVNHRPGRVRRPRAGG
ncbi:MAG: AAA family ATPase [Planctomycetes bacterium]|nr:AAA family ATPase [Planctomycetota bacterium]